MDGIHNLPLTTVELGLLGLAVSSLLVEPDGLLPDQIKSLDWLEEKLKRLAIATPSGSVFHAQP